MFKKKTLLVIIHVFYCHFYTFFIFCNKNIYIVSKVIQQHTKIQQLLDG